MRCSWSGARLHHSLAAVGARRLLSTPSREPFDPGLGSALARTLARSGLSPKLTGFTFGVSSGGLKFLQVPCVYQFHHSGWLDSLPSPFSPDYRRACSNCTARLAPSWLLAVQETNSGCMLESLETRAIPKLCGPLPCKEKDLTKEVLSPQCLPISPSGRRLPNAHLRHSVTRAARTRNALVLSGERNARSTGLSPSPRKKGSRSFPCISGAGKESRTLDLNLGKVALYQLSYSRIYFYTL